MRYRWKPNASQKSEYRQRCEERDSIGVITTHNAIRKGCYVEYYSLSRGEVIKGTVIKDSYGAGRPVNDVNSQWFGTCEKGQHTFTIQTEDGDKVLVKGRNLYPNIINHIPGEISKSL